MMREALANLEDTDRVKRVLLELSRFYNPVTHGPVIGLAVRRAVLTNLAGGNVSGAREALESHLAEYLSLDVPRSGRAVGMQGGSSEGHRD